MDVNLLLGATTIAATGFGIWGLVFHRKNGNGKHSPADVAQAVERDLWQVDKLAEVLQPLAALPQKLELIYQRLAAAHKEPEPEWSLRMLEHLEYIQEQLSEPVPSPWPPELVPLVERLVERMEEPPPLPQPVEAAPLADVIQPLTQRIEDLLATMALPRVEVDAGRSELLRMLQELPTRLAEILAAERSRIAKSSAPPGSLKTAVLAGEGGEAGGGGNPPAPPRRAPPNLPRLTPGMVPATPQIPAAYVGGSVYIPAGDVWSLLVLIQQQLSPNCPGSSVEFAVEADPGGDPILVGGASILGGPLTADNYAYQLAPASPRRVYRSSYPGNNTPIGELQVLAAGGGWLHVEVQS